MGQKKGILYYSIVMIAACFVFLGMLNSFRFLDGMDGGAVHLKALVLGGALVGACFLYVLGILVKPGEHSSKFQIVCEMLQIFTFFIVLAGAVYVRAEAARTFALQAEQQDRTTYEIARYLQEGNIQDSGNRYCDYLSENPYYFGYSWLLSLAFRFMGPYVSSGQYLNIFFSVIGLVCLYGCGKKLGGFGYGMLAMIIGAFWPAQILQIVLLSSNTVFTTIILLGFYLYLCATRKEYGQQEGASIDIVRFLLLGVVVAISCILHPAGWIFAAVILLAVCMQKKQLPNIPLNDIPLTQRYVARGYRSAILIGLSMFLAMTILNTNVELAINRDVVSSWTCAEKYLYSDFIMYEEDVDKTLEEQYLEQLTHYLGSDGQLYEQLRDSFQKQKEPTVLRMQLLRRAENAARVFYPVLLFYVLLSLIQAMTRSKKVDPVFVWSLLAALVIALFPGIAELMGQLQFVVVLLLAVDGAYGVFRAKSRKAMIQNAQLMTCTEVDLKAKQSAAFREEDVKLPKTEEPLSYFDLEKEIKEGHIVMTMTEASEKEYLAELGRKNTKK